ncbi:MAG TPA: hypothetical protein VEJ37_10375 [Xanthobacteraceae bacterium]|nr:hypothetical protein [Xanthobacteraceae bacterium]
MWIRHASALVGLMFALSAAGAQDFRIEDGAAAKNWDVARLKPGVIVFSDQQGVAGSATNLIGFADWARSYPAQKKFLALFPGYSEPTVSKSASTVAAGGSFTEKLTMYVAQARFILYRPSGAVDLARYVTLPFLERIDPAITHRAIAAADVTPLADQQGTGNENPQRKWCTGRASLICIQSSYKLEGKIPIGIMLVNKLRDSAKKVSDHIDFESELSDLPRDNLDQAGLKELTALDTPVSGVLEQNIFYVNQIMKFGKFLAVFQAHPSDAGKTVVTAFMALAVKASVLDERRGYEKVPVLHNLVPAQVLMGQSSFNSGDSISAGLPKYARNEIRTIAGLLAAEK